MKKNALKSSIFTSVKISDNALYQIKGGDGDNDPLPSWGQMDTLVDHDIIL